VEQCLQLHIVAFFGAEMVVGNELVGLCQRLFSMEISNTCVDYSRLRIQMMTNY
jgi:hypothetical protein